MTKLLSFALTQQWSHLLLPTNYSSFLQPEISYCCSYNEDMGGLGTLTTTWSIVIVRQNPG